MSQALPLITRQGDRIAIVSGLRTPFARQATAFHGIPAVDLGKMVVGEMLARSDIPPEVIEQLVFGQVVQMPAAPNIAREIVLGTGMNVHTDAYSVSRACATSFQAVANVAESLMAGTIRAGIAGGADSSSVLPIGVSKKLARILVDANKARTTGQKLKLLPLSAGCVRRLHARQRRFTAYRLSILGRWWWERCWLAAIYRQRSSSSSCLVRLFKCLQPPTSRGKLSSARG